MKCIIAGSRSIRDFATVLAGIGLCPWFREITEVVSGGAIGVDRLGEQWARDSKRVVTVFEANWKKHGNAAGPIRNQAMVDYAEALIAIHDGQSRGTADVIERAKKLGRRVFVHVPKIAPQESAS